MSDIPNLTVYRADMERGRVLSTELSRCEYCNKEGYVGDWPDEGGLVADTTGRLQCDECAESGA